MAICQTGSTTAKRVGNSGLAPPPYNDSRFVADEAPGRLDVETTISTSGSVVSVCIETTRHVGSVDADGFLVHADQHFLQGTLTRTLLLTMRARIEGLEVGGLFGVAGGGRLNVEVFLHKGTPNEKSLGSLRGRYGIGPDDWQEFELDVDIRWVKFPSANPLGILPVGNEITLEFTGTAFPIHVEIDWLTLEPRNTPGLGWRPVLLVHGLATTSISMLPGTAWNDGLRTRDIGFELADVTPKGSVMNNGAELTKQVADLKAHFGVDKVHMLGHSKGAIDGREYVNHHDDIETLIMLAGPNAGSFIADAGSITLGMSGTIGEYFGGSLYMSGPFMRVYNLMTGRNPATTYVTASGDHDFFWSNAVATIFGPNDDIVTVESAEVLSYAQAWTYLSATVDTDHSGLRINSRVVDDLVPAYIAALTAPPGPRPPGDRLRRTSANRSQETAGAGVQSLMSVAGLARPGETIAHVAVVDEGAAAIFVMAGDQTTLRFELVDPTGSRIAPTTTDPAITYGSYQDVGSLSYAGYHVQAPAPGIWTLEAIGADGAAAEGAPFIVTALTPTDPGGGRTLAAALDRDQYSVGDAVTITATFSDAGVPMTDVTIGATVVQPDGTTIEVALVLPVAHASARTESEYSGTFTVTMPGFSSIVVSAARTSPACTRLQPLLVVVTASKTQLSGTFADHGVDTTGDALYDQLVIDVGVIVDLAATYRVAGTLTDGVGTTIARMTAEQELPAGSQTVSLSFDGATLFNLGYDGAYVLESIALEEVSTALRLDSASPYTTTVYAHTQFQRPACVLTGRASDHGVNTDRLGLVPYEQLSISVEVDALTAGSVKARASLFSDDGTFIDAVRTVASLQPGINQVEFRFAAPHIFQAGKPGPYTLRLFSLWGSGLSLRAPGVVAVTQPYALEDFAESPRFAVGGTVSGLEGTGLALRDSHFIQITPGNGPFAFPTTVLGGDAYAVTIASQPSNPIQICAIANGSGTVTTANITNIAITCSTTPAKNALDSTFGPGGRVVGFAGGAIAIGLQSDGRIVVLGGRVLSRYTTDGRVDTSFGVNGQASVVFNGGVFDAAQGMVIQPDDKIVVVGFTQVGSTDDFAIARFDRDGVPDASFGTGGKTSVGFSTGTDRAWSALIQPDGGLIIAGHASVGSLLGGGSDFALARLTAQGILDTAFGTGGRVTTNILGSTDLAVAAALTPDGKIVLAGRVIDSSGDERVGLARYDTAGTLDGPFGAGGIAVISLSAIRSGSVVADVSVQSNGRIIICGSALANSGAASGVSFGFALARLTTAGELDAEFGSAGVVTTIFSTQDDFARGVALDAAGRAVVVGQTSNRLNPDFAIARYTDQGTLDPSFGDAGKLTVDFFGSGDQAVCLVMQPDGFIVAAGSVRNVTSTVLGMVRVVSVALPI